MDNAVVERTPMHLWIVGGLATLWNGFGAYDYWMTRTRDVDYLAGMMPSVDPQAMLAWVDAFPIWAQFGGSSKHGPAVFVSVLADSRWTAGHVSGLGP